MTIEALCLALDDVIFDTEEMHLAACNAAFEVCELTLRWSPAQYRKAAQLHGAHQALKAVCPALHAAQARELLERAAQEFRQRAQSSVPRMQAGCAVLMEQAQLHGCKLAVVTDMPAPSANAMLQQAFGNAVNNSFAVTVSGACFTDGSAPHALALRTMGVDAESGVVLEAAGPGLLAARRAGILAIAVEPGPQAQESRHAVIAQRLGLGRLHAARPPLLHMQGA